jgi:hypothetical protein
LELFWPEQYYFYLLFACRSLFSMFPHQLLLLIGKDNYLVPPQLLTDNGVLPQQGKYRKSSKKHCSLLKTNIFTGTLA